MRPQLNYCAFEICDFGFERPEIGESLVKTAGKIYKSENDKNGSMLPGDLKESPDESLNYIILNGAEDYYRLIKNAWR